VGIPGDEEPNGKIAGAANIEDVRGALRGLCFSSKRERQRIGRRRIGEETEREPCEFLFCRDESRRALRRKLLGASERGRQADRAVARLVRRIGRLPGPGIE
jgi:hypothetical protein